MTAKRFQWVYIKDNSLELQDNGIVKVFNNDRLEELLNELHEENNLLKDIIKDIVVQLDANHTFHTYQMTIPINKVIYNELKRRLKETSFNEELRGFFE